MDASTKHWRGACALANLFSAVALIAGCGGGSDATGPAPIGGAPAPAPAPAPVPPPAPAPSPPAPAPAPAPIARTTAGDPEGLPTSATIGAAGGALASSDGRLRISIPAGALAADTTISIQPITATAPGAVGPGYRLGPEGLAFAKPVTLTFGYSIDEASAGDAQLLRIATRDARGIWGIATASLDAAQRNLSASATHFSDWSFVGGQQIAPASAVVAVGKKLSLRVVDCGTGPDPDSPTAPPVLRECQSVLADTTIWSVNGIAGGDSSVGTMNSQFAQGLYTAPASLPPSNPVAISTEVDSTLPPLPPAPTPRTVLVSKVKVVDGISAYSGTIFGRVVTRISGQEQFVEISANLRFTLNPTLSVGGDRFYDGTGTAVLRAASFGCTAGRSSSTVALDGATLALYTEGSLAGTYSISAGARGSVSMTCGDPPQTMAIDVEGGAGGGGSSTCPSLQIPDNPGVLVNSWACDVAPGNNLRSYWTLRAIE
jgi:hypothetical protein